MRGIRAALMAMAGLLASGSGIAGEADVLDATVTRGSDGTFSFEVTIRSNDRGWDYYADGFEVLAPDGTVLGSRTLLHPHETEQPFTRALQGVRIPDDLDRVVIRAHHKPKGYVGETLIVTVPR